MALRIIRPTKRASLISARVFDRMFKRNLLPHVEVSALDLSSWLDSIFGAVHAPSTIHQSGQGLRSTSQSADFLCPDHHGIPLLPRLAWLRNHSRASLRLLLIAHAPAAYLLDWALLRPLLRPGDRIIAPTESARELIEFVCPSITSFVRVIPHPILPLNPKPAQALRAVFLGRLVQSKLVHRLIDALQIVHRRGHAIAMDIAGPLGEPNSAEESTYVRSLRARIQRMRLESHVRLLGTVDGEDAKAGLLAEARMLLNPSVSLEESFGKSIVEALGCGVPSVVTKWDGLPEVAGAGGSVVPVSDERFGMDVSADVIADVMEGIIDGPSKAEVCREEAQRFHPARVSLQYRHALEEALEEYHEQGDGPDNPEAREPGAPTTGLLSVAAPLNAYSWRELFEIHVDEFEAIRLDLAGKPRASLSEGGHVRTRLFHGQRGILQRVMAGLKPGQLSAPTGKQEAIPPNIDFMNRISLAAAGKATRSSRVVCLELLTANHQTAMSRAGLNRLRSEGLESPGIDYLDLEILLQEDQIETALNRSLECLDGEMWGAQAAHRLCQLARIAAAGSFFERALPRLREWTLRFPDEPDSGKVWLARGLCAAGNKLPSEARECLDHARDLLGEHALIDHLILEGI